MKRSREVCATCREIGRGVCQAVDPEMPCCTRYQRIFPRRYTERRRVPSYLFSTYEANKAFVWVRRWLLFYQRRGEFRDRSWARYVCVFGDEYWMFDKEWLDADYSKNYKRRMARLPPKPPPLSHEAAQYIYEHLAFFRVIYRDYRLRHQEYEEKETPFPHFHDFDEFLAHWCKTKPLPPQWEEDQRLIRAWHEVVLTRTLTVTKTVGVHTLAHGVLWEEESYREEWPLLL